jgi:hypothetical protein
VGTEIGVATSVDNGKRWKYQGTAKGLNFEPGYPQVIGLPSSETPHCTADPSQSLLEDLPLFHPLNMKSLTDAFKRNYRRFEARRWCGTTTAPKTASKTATESPSSTICC